MHRRDVVLDTNFLLLPGQSGVTVFREIDDAMHEPYRLCVLDGTRAELERLSTGDSNDARAARLGLDLLEVKELTILDGDEVDDRLVDYAAEGAVIATQDSELQERIRDVDGALLRCRQQQHVILEE